MDTTLCAAIPIEKTEKIIKDAAIGFNIKCR